MKRIAIRTLLGLALLLTVKLPMLAQCAMCRGSVESSVSAGDTSMASNLNIGILYLFFTPYIAAALIGYFWYKASRKNKHVRKVQSTGSFAG